jgi:hypothetical protein
MARGRVGILLATSIVALTVGCGEVDKTGGAESPPPKPVPTEAYSLLPDGSVPWVDEPATDRDILGPPRTPRRPAPGTQPCRAEQLTGELTKWYHPDPGAGEGEQARPAVTPGGHLIGYVVVHNTSAVECSLQGEVPTRMLAAGAEISMLYAHGISGEARARVTVVPVGDTAQLRLDWSGPLCAPVSPPFALVIELPNRGGTLHAAVEPTDRPGCAAGEMVNPTVTATLYASGFSETPPPEPPLSPLAGLVVKASGPATVHAGDEMTYHVDITNPTAKAIALDPCPGYIVELFSIGDATHRAINTNQVYRLNCRPMTGIRADTTVRYTMRHQVPDTLTTGRHLGVSWRLFGPALYSGRTSGGFTTVSA